ncbi:MAG: EfeM/EfeO family lipoprotein [Subtercola sp.]|nr:EfeM/EfeO family lipoprotein [Subtercola sp.]
MSFLARRPARRVVVVCVTVAAVIVVVAAVLIWRAGQNGSGSSAVSNLVEPDGSVAVTAGLDDCGEGWSTSAGGALTFTVKNSSISSMDVYLQDARTAAVYAELEGLGPDASATLTAVLGDGSYEFVCIGGDSPITSGKPVSITNAATRSDLTPGIVPVTRNDLYAPTQQYSAWITSQLPVLVTGVTALESSIQSGDRETAKRAWIAAHVTYEQLGAAYGAFGDADTAINGTPAAGLTADTDPDLTGFHRIEAILWGNQPVSAADPFGAKLISDAVGLQGAFASARLDPLDVGLRSHEILENSVQEELNGTDDAGSGSTFPTIDANITGTAQAVKPLRDLLASRGYDLASLDDWLGRSSALVESYHQPDGSWTPLAAITRDQREKLNATLSQTVELLAPVAAICDVRQGAGA